MIASRFTRTYHASIVNQYVNATILSDHPVDGALPTLFVGDIQGDLSETQ